MNPSYLLTVSSSPHFGVCGVDRGPTQPYLALMPPSGPYAEKGPILEVGNSLRLHGSQPARPPPFGEGNSAQLGHRRPLGQRPECNCRHPTCQFS